MLFSITFFDVAHEHKKSRAAINKEVEKKERYINGFSCKV
jgi:hypothetical protein